MSEFDHVVEEELRRLFAARGVGCTCCAETPVGVACLFCGHSHDFTVTLCAEGPPRPLTGLRTLIAGGPDWLPRRLDG